MRLNLFPRFFAGFSSTFPQARKLSLGLSTLSQTTYHPNDFVFQSCIVAALQLSLLTLAPSAKIPGSFSVLLLLGREKAERPGKGFYGNSDEIGVTSKI